VSFKDDDGGHIHLSIGKVSFTESQLQENFLAFIEALKKAKPQSAKGTYIDTIFLTSSMGPSIKVENN
jgi:large subunit ribosomal protein L1